MCRRLQTLGAAFSCAILAVAATSLLAGLPDEVPGVIASVGPHGHPVPLPVAGKKGQGRLLFGSPGCLCGGAVDDEAMPVLHQEVPPVAEPGLFSLDAGDAGVPNREPVLDHLAQL